MRIVNLVSAALACFALPAPAMAWGNEGHETIALIARSYLTPNVRAKVDAILASDPGHADRTRHGIARDLGRCVAQLRAIARPRRGTSLTSSSPRRI